jgi:hypothetical protein
LIFLLSSSGVVIGVSYCGCDDKLKVEFYPISEDTENENHDCCENNHSEHSCVLQYNHENACHIEKTCCKHEIDYIKTNLQSVFYNINLIPANKAKQVFFSYQDDSERQTEKLCQKNDTSDYIQKNYRKKIIKNYIKPIYPDDSHTIS